MLYSLISVETQQLIMWYLFSRLFTVTCPLGTNTIATWKDITQETLFMINKYKMLEQISAFKKEFH